MPVIKPSHRILHLYLKSTFCIKTHLLKCNKYRLVWSSMWIDKLITNFALLRARKINELDVVH